MWCNMISMQTERPRVDKAEGRARVLCLCVACGKGDGVGVTKRYSGSVTALSWEDPPGSPAHMPLTCSTQRACEVARPVTGWMRLSPAGLCHAACERQVSVLAHPVSRHEPRGVGSARRAPTRAPSLMVLQLPRTTDTLSHGSCLTLPLELDWSLPILQDTPHPLETPLLALQASAPPPPPQCCHSCTLLLLGFPCP